MIKNDSFYIVKYYHRELASKNDYMGEVYKTREQGKYWFGC